jgi:hypothetical protein
VPFALILRLSAAPRQAVQVQNIGNGGGSEHGEHLRRHLEADKLLDALEKE